jgi:uncharacterized protein YrrD
MLITGSQLVGTPIMSLQTGMPLGAAEGAIINPSNLKIVAYEVEGPNLDQHPSLLLVSDIREFSDMGMIIDSSDEFVGAEDVIKLKPLYDLKFTVLGKQVVDERRQKIGKVVDYTIEPRGFVIQQLSVKRPLLKSINEAELLVHRSQIVEINDRQIIVKAAHHKKTASNKKGALDYVNPFKQKAPQPETAKIDTHS